MFHMKYFVLFPSIELLLNKTDFMNINLAKPTWTIFRLPFVYLHFKGILKASIGHSLFYTFQLQEL